MSSGEPSRLAPRRLAASVGSLLRSRHLQVVAAALAVVLALPSLGVGWMIDDYWHRTVLLERSRLCELLGSPSEMFRFFRGDPNRTGRIIDLGLFPWWTDPGLKAELLQALTVLTHRLDYALWPDSPVLMHAHNLFWLGAVAAVTAVFYRRMLGPTWAAGVAALLFAVDDARGPTVGFLANRNALVAATFGVSALIAHDRWRRDGSRPSAMLSPLLLLAALFSKEEGIGTCAYLAAYAMFVDPAGQMRGILRLWPHVAAVVGWAALRASWGYGVRDVGLYIDPLTDTGRFLSAAVGRLPILLLGQWTPIPAEVSAVLPPPLLAGLSWFAAAFVLLLLSAMLPLLRRDPIARFWAAGMILAAIPVCATLPMDRLLTFPGIGAFGLLARFWAFVFGDGVVPAMSERRRVPAPMMAIAWFLMAIHAVIAPIVLPFRAAGPIGPRWIEHRLYVRAPLGPSAGDRTLVIVNAPSVAHATYLILLRDVDGQPVPRYTRVLAPAMPSVTIRRLDERTLAIRPRGGYLRWALDQVFRSERRPLAHGEQVKLTGMTITVTALTDDGRPAEATFRFDVPLESPSLLWLCFRGNTFEPFVPPAVGREVEIDFDWKAMLSPARQTGHPAEDGLDGASRGSSGHAPVPSSINLPRARTRRAWYAAMKPMSARPARKSRCPDRGPIGSPLAQPSAIRTTYRPGPEHLPEDPRPPAAQPRKDPRTGAGEGRHGRNRRYT
jgi:hypothetical protein